MKMVRDTMPAVYHCSVPQTPHLEKHFRAPQFVRDIIIGTSDGLTVPFALAAGLSGALVASGVVVTAGLAELTAGAISMGLGGFLAAQSDAQHYATERRREVSETKTVPRVEEQEVIQVLTSYGVGPSHAREVARALEHRPKAWVDFMMRFELGLEKPKPRQALKSALTVGGSYALGGFVPLAPYFFFSAPNAALPVSIGITALALVTLGAVKATFTSKHPVRGAAETLFIGALAAGAAYLLARLVS